MMRLSRRQLFGSALAAGVARQAGAAAHAEPVGEDALAALFRRRAAEAGLPGAAAVLIRPGEPARTLCAGYASLPFDVPVTPATLFHTGSVGKHITAVAVLRLVDAGRMDLRERIGRYSTIVPKAWRDVPLDTILAHSSGIPDYGGGIVWDRPFGRTEFLADAGDRPLDFAPGAAWRYCNAAYTLLGYLIEEATGQSYGAVVADLFARAGLRDSRVDDGEAVIPRRAEPYERRGAAWFHATPMSSSISSVAAGGILMSPRDAPAWKAALAGDRLLSPAARAAMATPFRFNSGRPSFYNMGWVLDAMPDGRAFRWHTGSVSGFNCVNIEVPASGVSMMFFCNMESDADILIAMELVEAFAPGSTPLALRPIRDRAPRLTAAARSILTRAAPWDTALFAPEMRIAIERFGDEVIDTLGAPAPPVLAFVPVQETRFKEGFRRRYRVATVAGTRHLWVGYTTAGLIYSIDLL